MKKYNILGLFLLLFLGACTEDAMQDINKDQNNAEEVSAYNLLPTVIVESSYGTTGTDLAWYSSVYIEHNAGTEGQLKTADTRQDVSNSVFDNSWNSIYSNLETLKIMQDKCSSTGSEPTNYICLGISQVLTAYNLAVLADMWGDVPYTEALKGNSVMQPKFDKQKDVYTSIFALLDSSILNFEKTTPPDVLSKVKLHDLIYGGSASKWKKAAYALKARYTLRLSKQIDNLDQIDTYVANAFSSEADALIFNSYSSASTGENPWKQFLYSRDYLATSQTFYDILVDHNDPRLAFYVVATDEDAKGNPIYSPAPQGEASGFGSENYSVSYLSYYDVNPKGNIMPTPLMSYHELLFIQAEAKFRKQGKAAALPILKAAVEAAFSYYSDYGLTSSADDYFTTYVQPKFEANPLTEILTQKYIAGYEVEAMEAYHDYRRTGIPALKNPFNATPGFVNRLPFATSEVTANSANVPQLGEGYVFKTKVWWATGTLY